jgi:thymidylate synthase
MLSLVVRDISELWWLLLRECLRRGYRQDVARGSFAGEAYRLQLKPVSAEITCPVVEVPPVPDGIPAPTSMDYVNDYYWRYLLGSEKSENETYTYGERILLQLEQVISMLRRTSETNQASITIAEPTDIDKSDPPCLRELDFVVVGGELYMSMYWRSHDLWAGLPTNLAGLRMLQEQVANEIGIAPGPMFYFSSKSHLYSYQIEYARIVCHESEKGEIFP